MNFISRIFGRETLEEEILVIEEYEQVLIIEEYEEQVIIEEE